MEDALKLCNQFVDSSSNPLLPNTWYWITAPCEGDIWHPILVQKVYYLMDGKVRHNFHELMDMIVKKAEMPLMLGE
jgi:hypothetical protein